MTVLQATFISPLAGTIYLRSADTPATATGASGVDVPHPHTRTHTHTHTHSHRQVMGEEAQIWGRLFWINDTNGTIDHNWHIHELLVSVLVVLVCGNVAWYGIMQEMAQAFLM